MPPINSAQPRWGSQTSRLLQVLGSNNPSTVKEVLELQAGLQDVLEKLECEEYNPVSSFNSLYQTITQQVSDDLGTPDGFHNTEFINELDVQFAARYFNALRDWTLGDDDVVAQCWSLLFERWNDPDISPELGATLGVNAHVNFDLAQALMKTYEQLPGQQPMGDLQHKDYLKINDIFHNKIPVITERLSRERYHGHKFKVLRGGFELWVEGELVVGTRNLAWHASKKLWDARGDAAATAEEVEKINDTSSHFARFLVSPVGLALFARPIPSRDAPESESSVA